MLPYLTRSLLYLSPILYEATNISDRIKKLEIANPMFYLLDSWSRVVVHARHLRCMDFFTQLYGRS
jgi:teichoic acid transport system permease protein